MRCSGEPTFENYRAGSGKITPGVIFYSHFPAE